MTNRDYMMGLSNERLARVLNELKIFDLDCNGCNGDCIKCVTKWLETERKPNVEEGQIRETDSHKWLVGIVSTNRDICGIVSETGEIRYIPTDIVDTWKIVTDETEEIFCNRIIHNFYFKGD